MRAKLLALSLVLLANVLSAQDIDLYHRQLNDDFQLPAVNEQMSFEEFQILSRQLRMQDMLYAMIFPGYAHFAIGEKTTGWILFISRTAVYGTWLYTYYYAFEHRDQATINQWLINANVLWAESAFVFANYFYDWIHAKTLLQRKKDMIRYKYSMKLQFAAVPVNHSQFSPTIGLRVNF